MDGAFNDVVLTLSPGARAEDVITRLDPVLDRYGGLGAVARKDQPSHRFLSEEFRQLQQSARIYPAIFISVAAFLLNVVITRTVSTQREQIAALKAFGYATADVAVHYIKLVLVIVGLGVFGGTLLGIWLGHRCPVFTCTFTVSPLSATCFVRSWSPPAACITFGIRYGGHDPCRLEGRSHSAGAGHASRSSLPDTARP